MATHRPVTQADYDQVKALHAEGLTRNAIAKRIGRAQSTVSKLAADMGLDFDRSRTAKATEAKVADAKERRAELATLALDDAHAMRARALAADTGRDARDYAAAYGVFIDRHLRLTEADADQQGLAAVDAWLRGITGT